MVGSRISGKCFVLHLLLLVSLRSFGQATVTSDFSSNADGWTVINVPNNYTLPLTTYSATGGNPGGYIAADINSLLPTAYYFSTDWYFTAPAKFNGNKSFAYNQILSFDLTQTLNGTDNSSAEVIISGGGQTIYLPVSATPSTVSWTPYTVLLKESAGWKTGGLAGAATTNNEMKQVLGNITSLRIRAKFIGNFSGTYSGRLDNVILHLATLGIPPAITSVSPKAGIPNVTAVTISGNNFNAAPASNAVFFGGARATVSNASATQLTVVVPSGAQFGRITATDLSTGLSAESMQEFIPQFNNNRDNGGQIIRASMDLKFDIAMDPSASKSYSNAGDIDGDGKIDLIVVESNFKKVSVLRNLGQTGDINASSFAAKVSLDIGYTSKGSNAIADLDGDGKLDIAVGTASAASALIAVFRNTSTSGNISFDPVQYVTASSYSDGSLSVAEMDGDGRPELLSAFNNSCGGASAYFSIFQNMSAPGDIEFASYQDFDFGILCQSNTIATGDLNSDGLLDVAVTSGSDNVVYVFQNASTPGTLSLASPFLMDSPGAATQVAIADLDADGKPDLAWSGANDIIVRKNIHNSGPLAIASFGADILLQTPLGSSAHIVVADMNADGKPDLVANDDSSLGIVQNVGAAGALSLASFTSGTAYPAIGVSVPTNIVVADFDGDNKPDAFFGTTNVATPVVSIFRNECFPAPRIDAVSPTSGIAGTSVALTGDYFLTGAVPPGLTGRLATILANTTSSANTSSNVVIPATGAISDRLNITVHGLTALGNTFALVFNTNRVIDASSFGASIDFPLGGNTRDALTIADWDDDGKPDVAVVQNFTEAKIFQNSATAGSPVTTSSLTLQAITFNGGYNMTALDIDGDGKTDLHSGAALFKNSSTPGSVSFLSGPNGIYSYSAGFNQVAAADFNKDGKIDLADANGSIDLQIYENQSTKGVFENNSYFSTYSTNPVNLLRPSNYGGVVAADFDGDGYDDLVTANQNVSSFTSFRNLAQSGPITSASFTSGTDVSTGTAKPYNLTTSDFDGDGKPDIAITYFNALYVSVHRNTSTPGTISFAAPVNLTSVNNGYNLRSQDMDGDGKAEIIVIHQPNPGPGSFTVLQNKSTSGTISFSPAVNFPITRNPQALAIADINLDQKPDILIVAVGALMVFENKLATVAITITQQPADESVCEGSTGTFNTAATGTTNIEYQWQFGPTPAGPFNDIADGAGYSGAATSTLSVNTTGNFGAGRYRCKISGDLATTVYTNDEGLFVNAVPPPPSTTDASSCTPGSLILSASGGTNGNYRWYLLASGGTPIPGEVNSSFTTPVLSSTAVYYASVVGGSCESGRTSATATIGGASCTGNLPPAIVPTPESTSIGGEVSINLEAISSDPDNNLDLSTLAIVQQPISGAVATIDIDYLLRINYQGISFTGTDRLTIQVCDLAGACTQQEIDIQVAGNVIRYNFVTPNGDGKNDAFILENIEILPSTQSNRVTIYNRWGDEVFDVTDYDNTSHVFKGNSADGKQLPSGTYFYKVTFTSGAETLVGYLELKR